MLLQKLDHLPFGRSQLGSFPLGSKFLLLVAAWCLVLMQAGEAGDTGDTATELHINVREGLGALTRSAPLKV